MRTQTRLRRTQRGMALLESLIGMLILSIATLGAMLALAQSSQVQYVNGIRSQIIEHLRGRFLQEGVALCGTQVVVPVNGKPLQAVVSCTELSAITIGLPGAAPVEITVPAADAQIITAKVDSPLLGGPLTVSSNR